MRSRTAKEFLLDNALRILNFCVYVVLLVPAFKWTMNLYININHSLHEAILFSILNCILIAMAISYVLKDERAPSNFQKLIYIVKIAAMSLPFTLSLIIPYTVFKNSQLAGFISILTSLILLKIYSMALNFKSFKILLNIMRFTVIIVAILDKYLGTGTSNLENADKAIVASLAFDAIVSSFNFKNHNRRSTSDK